MEKYINEIPLVVRNAIKGLSDERRQGILMYLLKEGSKSFTDINKELKISKNNLSHHLKVLLQYGLLYNYYNRNRFANKYSFYEVSKLGKKVINNFINLVTPIPSEEMGLSINIREPFTWFEDPSFQVISAGEFRVWGRKITPPLSVFVAGTGTIDEEMYIAEGLGINKPFRKESELQLNDPIW